MGQVIGQVWFEYFYYCVLPALEFQKKLMSEVLSNKSYINTNIRQTAC